jgi:hypothetical protein
VDITAKRVVLALVYRPTISSWLICEIASIPQPADAVQANERLESMAITPVKFSPPSDTIKIHEITTGSANVGNGGNGTNYGDITNKPVFNFDPYNEAYGSTVHVNTGDHVHQYASWDAGGANGINVDPPSWQNITGSGGTANSNGDQYSQSGYDTSHVYANTTAYQPNYVWSDQSQHVYAGLGGGGGGYSQADTGDVQIDLMSLPSLG